MLSDCCDDDDEKNVDVGGEVSTSYIHKFVSLNDYGYDYDSIITTNTA